MAATEPALFPSQGRSNVPAKQTFHLELTYGASGPASAKGNFLAVGDTTTGQVTVTFPKTYRRLVGFRWGWTKLAAGAVYFPIVVDRAAIATASTSGGGTLVIETRAEDGTATDPASGSVLALEFDVTNDILDDGGAITVT